MMTSSTTTSGTTTTTTITTGSNTLTGTVLPGDGVLCGNNQVCLNGQVCCFPLDKPNSSLCVPVGNCGFATASCDDHADCANGESCCVAKKGDQLHGVACMLSCTGDSEPLCKSDADCGGETCQQHEKLPAGYKVCD